MRRVNGGRLRAGAIRGGAALVLLGPAVAVANFVDVTPASMNAVKVTLGASWADFDGDGDLDLFRGHWTSSPVAGVANELFRNDGSSFVDRAGALGVANANNGSAGGTFADYDADGDPDLILNVTGSANILFRNDQTAGFRNVTPSIIANATPSGRSAIWVDHDRDGDLDLFLANTSAPSALLRNDGAGGFVAATPAPLDAAAQTSAWGDYNADGFPDFFSSTTLARNNGDGTFTAIAGVIPADGSLAAHWGDFDGDGDLDLLRASLPSSANRLFRNDGGDAFVDVSGGTLGSGGYGASAADYDNDGDLDIWIGFPGYGKLYRNDGGMTFADSGELPPVTGNNVTGTWADYDGDGDLDLCVAKNEPGGPVSLLRNDLGGGNHWLHVDLVGSVSNRDGIGSRVEVTALGRTQVRDVHAGGDSWCGQSSLREEFGLGPASTATSVVVRWPSGRTSTLASVDADQVITVYEPGGLMVATSPYTPGATFEFRVDRNDTPAQTMTLHYRVAGMGGVFSSDTMTLTGGSFVRALASSFASEHGLEYWLEYTQNGGGALRFPREGPARPAFLPAALGNRTWTRSPAGGQYVIFGVPFNPSNGTPDAVLDELGAYDPKRWRCGRWNPATGSGAYAEFPSVDPFAPGRGYWLVQKSPVAIAAAGTSTNTVAGLAITLRPGWNQIAHPYLFPVTLANVDFSGAPNVEPRLVEWNGSAYADVSQLAPWGGYWMRNNALAPQTIVIPGVTSAGPAPPATRSADGWRLAFTAAEGALADRGNVAGVSPVALEALDPGDFHAPPALPGTPRVFFEAIGDDGTPHELDVDLRPEGSGAVWTLVIQAGSAEEMRLVVDGIATLPAGVAAALFPEDTFAAIDLRETHSLRLAGGRTHRLRLAVGEPAWVEGVRTGAVDVPQELALGLAWPNPFSRDTSIGFALPAAARVDVGVFDVAGRRVRTLTEETRAAGRHVLSWDGRDAGGGRAAPGVYFVRLATGGRALSQRLVLVD